MGSGLMPLPEIKGVTTTPGQKFYFNDEYGSYDTQGYLEGKLSHKTVITVVLSPYTNSHNKDHKRM